MTINMTPEEYHAMEGKPKRKSKYGNKKVKYDGYTFDSKAEHGHYLHLKDRVARGEIHNLVVHERFEIHPAFTDRYGIKRRRIVHEVDFSYDYKGTRVVVDVKGVETRHWRDKRKMFLLRYPEIDYQVVKV